jgi:hypothetical protein
VLISSDGSRVDLYDLKSDRQETTNVAAKEPDVATQLSDTAITWRRSLLGGPK